MSVCCYQSVTGRTHLHWRYRTLKARRVFDDAVLG